MQGLFRNPLVEPGIIGVMSDAAFSVTLYIVIGAEAFPAGTTFVSAETHKCASGFTSGLPQECKGTDQAGTFDGTTWTIGDMLAGEYASLFVTVTLNADTDGKTLNNTAAFVNPPEYDLVPGNNSSSASITVKHRLSGQVYYDLAKARADKGLEKDIAIVRVEQQTQGSSGVGSFDDVEVGISRAHHTVVERA